MLLLASILLLITGAAHSYLGERYILIRLFKRDNLPQVLGSTAFTAGTLRFVWHLTTVAWFALAYLLYSAAGGAVPKDQVLGAVGVASLVSAAFPLFFTRGKHLSWVVFLIVGGIALAARSGV